MSNETEYDLYVLSEIAYTNKHKLENEDELFPDGWYSSKNYKLKIQIIGEALEKDIDVKETDAFREAYMKGLFH